MTIRQADLSNAAFRNIRGGYVKRAGQQTAFLSHSHKDAILVLGLQALLLENGWDVYIDWQDKAMPDEPDARTATRIKNAILEADWFLFLATENSTASRWCPWEIGYADGKKPLRQIAVIPTQDSSGRYFGNEYLKLYPRIDTPKNGGLAHYDEHNHGRWIRDI